MDIVYKIVISRKNNKLIQSLNTINNLLQIINKYEINFTINNLYVNQMYLYGELFINVILN